MRESYRARRRRRASERGRRMAAARWRKDRERRERGEFSEASFEDQLARAKWDRKGEVIAEGCSYSADQVNPWQVRWSVAGWVNQMDLLFDGVVVFTGSRRRLRSLAPWLGRLL